MSERKSSSNSSTGISFLGMLGILFIGLKLTGYIDWSWWWVLLPLYGGILLVLAVGVIGLIVLGVLKLISD